MEFSPDGRRVVSIADDVLIARVWDAETGTEVAALGPPEERRGVAYPHEARFFSARFSPDGRRVVTATGTPTPHVWDAETGQHLFALKGHKGPVGSASFSPDGKLLLTGSLDETARLWDAETGKELRALRGHKCGVLNALFSPDGKRVLTTGDGDIWRPLSGDNINGRRGKDEKVVGRLWDVGTGEQAAALEWPDKGSEVFVRTAVFSADGRRVVTGGHVGSAQGNSAYFSPVVWEAATGKLLFSLRSNGTAAAHGAAVSPDGRWVVAGYSEDRSFGDRERDRRVARVWDADTGKEVAVLAGHQGGVLDAAFSPDGRRLITVATDGEARVWAAQFGDDLARGRGLWDGTQDAVLSPDGRTLLAANGGRLFADPADRNSLGVWDLAAGRERARLRGLENVVNHMALSPDGTRALTVVGFSHAVQVWDLATGKLLHSLDGHSGQVLSARFVPDGRRIAVACGDMSARLWDLPTGKPLASFKGQANFEVHAGVSPDGRYLYQWPSSYSNDPGDQNQGYLWDLESGQKVRDLVYHRLGPGVSNRSGNLMADWSPDGKRLLVVCPDGSARIWDFPGGEQRTTITDPDGGIWFARFSPDGRRIVTAPWNEDEVWRHVMTDEDLREKVWDEGGLHWHVTPRARVWDAETGAEIAVLQGSRTT